MRQTERDGSRQSNPKHFGELRSEMIERFCVAARCGVFFLKAIFFLETITSG